MEYKSLENALKYAVRMLRNSDGYRFILCYHVIRHKWSVMNYRSPRQIARHCLDSQHVALCRLERQSLLILLKSATIEAYEVDLKAYSHKQTNHTGLPSLHELLSRQGM